MNEKGEWNVKILGKNLKQILPGLAAAGAAAGAAFYARSEYEKNHFVTGTYVIRSEKIREKDRKFIFLTDLHEKRFGIDNAPLVRAIRREAPDGILVGGDMVVCRRSDGGKPVCEATISLLRRLAEDFPVWYSYGNHEDRIGETEPFFARLRESGVRILDDESEKIGSDLRITGCRVDEKYYRHVLTMPEIAAGTIERHVGSCGSWDGEERFELLMLHSPLFLKAAAAWGADLVLSGHFHGGTVRIPAIGGLMTPQYQFFCPYCAGGFEEGKTRMIVGRGLGTHSVNIRINDMPELLVLKLVRG